MQSPGQERHLRCGRGGCSDIVTDERLHPHLASLFLCAPSIRARAPRLFPLDPPCTIAPRTVCSPRLCQNQKQTPLTHARASARPAGLDVAAATAKGRSRSSRTTRVGPAEGAWEGLVCWSLCKHHGEERRIVRRACRGVRLYRHGSVLLYVHNNIMRWESRLA